MAIKSAEELFISQLKDIYSAEKQAVRAYPKITKAAQSEELKEALQEHLEQTKGQVERLERIFEILDKKSSGKTCEAMKGLITEAQEAMEEIEKGPVLDAAIIAAGQRIEHYEIASYGTVATFAEAMGQQEIHELLAETLQEEKETDERLTGVAQSVNAESLQAGEDEEGEEDDEEEEQPKRGRSVAKKSASKKSANKKSAAKSKKR